MSRRHISLKTKLAAALCNMVRPDENGVMRPVIDHESAKAMTEDQVLSLFNFDHWPVPKHRDGPDAHWNLTPRPIVEHREKSARVDTPGAAKDARLSEAQEEFRRKMLAKAGQETPLMQAIKDGRIKVTRSSFQTNRNGRFKKKMNGTVERRD